MAKELAIILNNGSLNSAVATALAVQKYRPLMLYAEALEQPGSRARAAYDQQVAHFKPAREHTLPMPFLTALAPLGREPAAQAAASVVLSDPRSLSSLAPRLLELLPLIAAAARFAAQHGASAIYLGLRVGEDGDALAQATEYVQVWNEMIQMPCARPEVEVITPLLELEPWQVVDVGSQVSAPFDRTWSCLDDGAEPCWACPGCRAREAAFQRAAKPDPMRKSARGA